jgi:hypothetical protein
MSLSRCQRLSILAKTSKSLSTLTCEGLIHDHARAQENFAIPVRDSVIGMDIMGTTGTGAAVSANLC